MTYEEQVDKLLDYLSTGGTWTRITDGIYERNLPSGNKVSIYTYFDDPGYASKLIVLKILGKNGNTKVTLTEGQRDRLFTIGKVVDNFFTEDLLTDFDKPPAKNLKSFLGKDATLGIIIAITALVTAIVTALVV